MKDSKYSISGNIYVVFLLRMLLIFGLYTLTRALFYLFNLTLFSDVSASALVRIFVGGLRFDTSAIVYTNLLVILLHILPFKFRYKYWYQQIIAYIFFIVNGLALTLNMIDSVYYRFTLRRTTTSVFKEFENEENGFGLFFRFIWDYWYVTLSVIALIFIMVYCYRKIRLVKPKYTMSNWVYYPVNTVLAALVAGLCLAGMRGGFAHSTRPITLSNASEYVDKPTHREIVLNTPFALIRTIGKTTLAKKSYFTDEECQAIFNPEMGGRDSSAHYGMLRGRNVVIMIVESFGREYVGVLNRDIPGYAGFTPFLDSLAKESYLFEHAFANGRKSIDALPSTLVSVPGMETCFVLSHYSGNALNSPASLLQKEGYNSAFFHGAPNGSMGFNALVKQAGFQAYYGKNEFNNNNEFDGMWGIWDEPFLSYMADQLNELPQPFVSAVFTVSSHHPFKVPAQYEGKFPQGSKPIHQCVGYTDNALRLFFEKAARMPWFNNTLFVITADHSSGPPIDKYRNSAGSFSIPMFFYAPGSELQGYNDSTVVQQCDILPTVMSLLGSEQPFISFGNDMFDASKAHFSVSYFNGAFQLIEGDYLFQFANEKGIGLYRFKTDRKQENNLIEQEKEVAQALEKKIKAIIQEYNSRLIDNRMTAAH